MLQDSPAASSQLSPSPPSHSTSGFPLASALLFIPPPPPPPARPNFFPHDPCLPSSSPPGVKRGPLFQAGKESDLHTGGFSGGAWGQASAVLPNTLLYAGPTTAAYLHICVPWDLIQGYESNDLHVLLRQILEVVLLLGRHGHRLLSILHHQATNPQSTLSYRQVCYSGSGAKPAACHEVQPKKLQLMPRTTTGGFRRFRS